MYEIIWRPLKYTARKDIKIKLHKLIAASTVIYHKNIQSDMTVKPETGYRLQNLNSHCLDKNSIINIIKALNTF